MSNRITTAELGEQMQALRDQVETLVKIVEPMFQNQAASPQGPTTEGGGTRTRKNRRGLATPDKRKTYLEYKIEVADRLAKEKGIHYSVFEIESGKLLLFSEITEHRNNQKGHKATEKWGPRLYNSKSGITATGTAYIS